MLLEVYVSMPTNCTDSLASYLETALSFWPFPMCVVIGVMCNICTPIPKLGNSNLYYYVITGTSKDDLVPFQPHTLTQHSHTQTDNTHTHTHTSFFS